ncbi:hypothetical protein TWF173_010936 [Orbilia oligospora]|nr:hypothetical protein TWF173_010936 [Orbilia oligospora]
MDQDFPLPSIFNNDTGVKRSIAPTITLTQAPTSPSSMFSSFTSLDDAGICWGTIEVGVGPFPSDINYDASGVFLHDFDNLTPIPVKYPECSSVALQEVDPKQPTSPLLQPAPNDDKALTTDNGPLSQGPDLSSSSPSIQDPPSIVQDKDPPSLEAWTAPRNSQTEGNSKTTCEMTTTRGLMNAQTKDANIKAHDNLKLHLRSCSFRPRSSHPPEASLQIAQKLKIGNGKRPRAFSASSDVSTSSQCSKRKRNRIAGIAKEMSSVASTMVSTPVSLQRQPGIDSPCFYPSSQETLANKVNESVSFPSYPNKKISLLGQSIGAEHQVTETTGFEARGGTAEDIATLHQIIRVLKENEDRHKQEILGREQEILGLMDELKDTRYKLKTWKKKALKQNRKCNCVK